MSVTCHSCQAEFADFRELAMHITKSRHGHKLGKKWAAKYLLINSLAPDKRYNHRNNGGKRANQETKNSVVYELSGKTSMEITVCPKCSSRQQRALPIEFTDSPVAWRVNKELAILCPDCGNKNKVARPY